jgi:hypothetical protein
LQGASNGKGLDYASLKLKTVAECEDLNILVDVMKFCLGVEGVNIRDSIYTGGVRDVWVHQMKTQPTSGC